MTTGQWVHAFPLLLLGWSPRTGNADLDLSREKRSYMYTKVYCSRCTDGNVPVRKLLFVCHRTQQLNMGLWLVYIGRIWFKRHIVDKQMDENAIGLLRWEVRTHILYVVIWDYYYKSRICGFGLHKFQYHMQARHVNWELQVPTGLFISGIISYFKHDISHKFWIGPK